MKRSTLVTSTLIFVAVGCGSSSETDPDASNSPADANTPAVDAPQDTPDSGQVPLVDATLTPDDATSGQFLGFSVALDGNTAVVGAPRDAENGALAGAAYVFVLSGDGWSMQAKLLPVVPSIGAEFGHAVAISGETLIVGAHKDRVSVSQLGSAYVFTRSGDTWTEQAKLNADDSAAGDEFGFSVDVAGDVALVGAFRGNPVGNDSGAAYVFSRTGTTWQQQDKLVAGDAASGDLFGQSVSISGGSALVGAPFDDDNGQSSGSAYVFVEAAGSWSEQQKLTASDADGGERFGFSVSLDADTVLIGASRNDEGAALAGAAYVFTRSTDVWTRQAQLIADDIADSDEFGSAVSLDGDRALIGSPLDNNDGGVEAGSAYVFSRTGTSWTQDEKLLNDVAEAGVRLGRSVAVDGAQALLGGHLSDVDGASSGTVKVRAL